MSGVLRTQIELRDPKSLKPYKHNNKRHPSGQIKKLMAMIAEYGFDQPIVIDKDGVIVKGHGRLAASLEMKLKQVPVIVADDLTAEQVRAARLADNEAPNGSTLDLDAIKFELGELDSLGFNLTLTGFDTDKLNHLLSDLPTTEYQAPQQFGGWQPPEKGDRPEHFQSSARHVEGGESEGGEGGEGGEEPEPEPPSASRQGEPSDERFPLPIVLTWAESNQWKALKEQHGIASDKRLLMKLAGIAD